MYSTTHQFSQRAVNNPVTLKSRVSDKPLGDDQQAVVSSLAGTGVSGVQSGIVGQFKS